MTEVPVREQALGPALPTLTIGNGPRHVAMLPGLSPSPGLPTGHDRELAVSGWEPLLDRYTVYRIGRRVRPVGTTFESMAEDVSTALEAIDPPVDLIGASTGGAIALLVAASRPDLVRRLVLVITGLRLSDDGERERAVMLSADHERRTLDRGGDFGRVIPPPRVELCFRLSRRGSSPSVSPQRNP